MATVHKTYKVVKMCVGYDAVSIQGMKPDKLVNRLARKYPVLGIFERECTRYVLYRRSGEYTRGKAHKVRWAQVAVYTYEEATNILNKGAEVNE
jgi:hypothetical protein